MTRTVIAANLGPDGWRQQVDHLTGMRPSVVLGCEVGGKPSPAGMLRHQRGKGRGARDVAIFTREKPEKVRHVKLAEGILDNRGNDRWLPTAPPRYALGVRLNGISFWSIHLHYPSSKTWRQWKESLRRLEELLLADLEAGYPTVFGGDLNSTRWPKFPRKSARKHVEEMCIRLGLQWYAPHDDVIWLAWTPGAIRDPRRFQLRGSDHVVSIRANYASPPSGEKPAPNEEDLMDTRITDALIRELRRRGVQVYTHAQWGSRFQHLYLDRLVSRPHDLLPGRPVDTLWNHITVTRDDGTLPGEFFADMREVERIGVQRFGTGFSYNFGVDANAPHPRIGIGQFMEARGAHTINEKGVPGYSLNQNKVALAVAWIGVPGDRINEHGVEAMVQLRAALITVGALTRHYDDVPHSLVARKDCPTDELRKRLPSLKQWGLNAVDQKPEPTQEDEVTPDDINKIKMAVADEMEKRLRDRRFWQRVLNTDLTPNVKDGANTIRNALRRIGALVDGNEKP